MDRAVKAWGAVRLVIEARRRGVGGVQHQAVEATIDAWFAACERLVPLPPLLRKSGPPRIVKSIGYENKKPLA